MTKPSLLILGALLGCSAIGASAAEKYSWRNHEAPFTFIFGNDIDSHQQTRLTHDGRLSGYLYIRYTGVVTKDGYRVATHVDCNTQVDCTVGWTIEGTAASASFLYHPMHDHPVFLLPRADVPQPGSFSHFHWTGPMMPMPHQPAAGYVLQLKAENSFCFIHHGAEPASDQATCRDNGGVAVDRGIDLATHLNIVTAAPGM